MLLDRASLQRCVSEIASRGHPKCQNIVSKPAPCPAPVFEELDAKITQFEDKVPVVAEMRDLLWPSLKNPLVKEEDHTVQSIESHWHSDIPARQVIQGGQSRRDVVEIAFL